MSLLTDYLVEERKLFKTFRSAGLYSFLASVCLLAMPVFMFSVYDSILTSRSVETLVALFLFALMILVIYGVFDYVRQMLLAKAGLELESKMAGLILAGELSRQSDAAAQTVRDLGSIRQVIASPAFYALFDLPMLPLFLTLIFLIHPVLGVFVLVGALVLLGMGIWGDRATAQLNKEHIEALIASHKSLEMQINSQEYIRAQGLYRESVRSWGKEHGTQLQRFISSFGITAKFSASSKSIRQIIQISMIGGGAMLVIFDQATAGIIFATAIIGGRALGPVEQIVGGWRALRGAYDTRVRLLARLGEMTLPENRTKLPRPKGKLEFVRVAYVPRPGMPPIIRGISAKIDAGDSVAVIGPSGAGKSTFAKLLVGFLVPNAGKIILDGQDLHAWDPIARGLHVGYMPQQVTFFEATVRENIARMRLDDPEEWAVEAAQRAGVHEIILGLPQGYDTLIKRGQFMPSGGQAQLIGLARAFYGDPAVLVLDEPNAALDNSGELILHKSLLTARKAGMTTIVISQRPSVLGFVEKVMIINEGIIKDFGLKEKVMSSGGVKAVSAPGKQAAGKQAAGNQTAGNQAAGKNAGQAAQTAAGNSTGGQKAANANAATNNKTKAKAPDLKMRAGNGDKGKQQTKPDSAPGGTGQPISDEQKEKLQQRLQKAVSPNKVSEV